MPVPQVDISIRQGAIRIVIPVVDAQGNPVDLTHLAGVCWTFGRHLSYPGDVTRYPGDEHGTQIITYDDPELPDDAVPENNALLVTLPATVARGLPAGRLYYHAAWADGVAGPVPMVTGMMDVVGTVWAKDKKL